MLLPPGAGADELLVMPYACKVIGGRTVLEPGPDVGHRIIGQRETRRFSACSPVNPRLCRNWEVHRFDLDCDGARVPWVSVVAAAGEMSRRARLVDGRLQLRMGPRWALPPDDPCARGQDPDDRFFDGRMRRHCADRQALAPPPVVEMPVGFAPMFGIDAIIAGAAPGITPPPHPPIVAQPPPDRPARAEPSWPAPFGEVPPSRPEREPVAREPQPPPSLVWPEATVEAPSKAQPEPASPPPVSEAPPKTRAPAPGAKLPASPAPPPPAAQAPLEPKAAAKVADSRPAPGKQEAAPAPAPKSPPAPATSAGPDDRAVSLNPFNILRATTTGAIVALAGLVLGLLTAFAVARRRERVRHAGMRPRDFASASLGGGRARPKPPARLGDARGRVPPNAAASAMGRVPGANAPVQSALAEWGERMPESRVEALQVLGIGVTPSANEAAIKKIVDGLRMSWHPDLARDEADRQLRELRSKQINAAWELLQRHRAEA